jgi:hypothetical protein
MQNKHFLYLAGVVYANVIAFAYGDSGSTNAAPINTPAQNSAIQAAGALSAQTQGIINQTQSLTDQARALIDGQLAAIPKQIVADAAAGHGDPIKSLITSQYLQALNDGIEAFDPKMTIDEAVLGDFQGYAIVGIDRVIIEKGVAFVDARIAYLPSRLAAIVADQAKRASDPNFFGGPLWVDSGGSSSSKICEKLGVGRATYYLVVQNGLWKLHFTYFSSDPLTPQELQDATKSMQTLIQ